VADVARRLGASQLLFVVMVDSGSGGSLQIDSTWIEPATGRSASRPAIDIAVLADARTRFIAAARQLLPDAPVRPDPPSGLGGTMSRAVPRHFTRTTWITTAIGVVGVGVGIGFGLRTRGLYADCDQTLTPCSPDDEDRIRTSALIADLGFLAAIGGAVATAVLYTTSGSESRLIVAPTVEGAGTGVSLTALGRF
jgi:drug/metabolite transporter (DMT)-like permease